MWQLAVRFRLLNKRLFKKCSFWMILCLVPALTAGMRLALREESGMACIAIYREDPRDGLTEEIVRQLTEERGLLRYVFCETQEEARALVAGGEADAAWIFPEDLGGVMEQVAVGRVVEPVVTMVEREDNVLLVLSREILCSVLYPYYSYEVYRDFVREDCGLGALSEEELLETYHETRMDSDLFRITLLDGTEWENGDYLLAPVRGMLALWLMLCGLAGAMYFLQDEREGIFDRIPLGRRLRTAFGMQAVLLCDGVIVLLMALWSGGLITAWPVEALGAVLFSCCIAALANLLRLLCRTLERLGSVIPILLLVMAVFSPVFVTFNGWRAVKLLLPPYYYLRSIHDSRYLWGMAAYTVVVTGLCILLDRRRQMFS
ncbi:MAG: ABC transporter permease [Blautia sp.]|nr:ABC transporter permease [Blautia sp.]